MNKKAIQILAYTVLIVGCLNWNSYFGTGCILLSGAVFLFADNA